MNDKAGNSPGVPVPVNVSSLSDHIVSSCCAVLSHLVVSVFATPWTVACQAPLSRGFPRQEYWTELPFPSLGDLPNPGIEPGSSALQADYLLHETPGKGSFKMTLRLFPILEKTPASSDG